MNECKLPNEILWSVNPRETYDPRAWRATADGPAFRGVEEVPKKGRIEAKLVAYHLREVLSRWGLEVPESGLHGKSVLCVSTCPHKLLAMRVCMEDAGAAGVFELVASKERDSRGRGESGGGERRPWMLESVSTSSSDRHWEACDLIVLQMSVDYKVSVRVRG